MSLGDFDLHLSTVLGLARASAGLAGGQQDLAASMTEAAGLSLAPQSDSHRTFAQAHMAARVTIRLDCAFTEACAAGGLVVDHHRPGTTEGGDGERDLGFHAEIATTRPRREGFGASPQPTDNPVDAIQRPLRPRVVNDTQRIDQDQLSIVLLPLGRVTERTISGRDKLKTLCREPRTTAQVGMVDTRKSVVRLFEAACVSVEWNAEDAIVIGLVQRHVCQGLPKVLVHHLSDAEGGAL